MAMLFLPAQASGQPSLERIQQKKQGYQMSNVAKIIELTSSSTKGIEDAVEQGIKRADSTLDNIEGAWVQDIKCVVKNGKVAEWRVNMKVTFLLK
jgi:dodecin